MRKPILCILLIAAIAATQLIAQTKPRPVAPKPAAAAAPNPLLTSLLSDKEDIRTAALAQLDSAAPADIKSLVPPLVKELSSSDYGHYYPAIVALGKIGPPAVPALTTALAGIGDTRRYHAALALQKIGPKAAPAVPALITSLAAKDQHVRLAAGYALAAIGPEAKAAVPALIKAASTDARYAAFDALAAIGPDAAPAFPTLWEAYHVQKINEARYAMGKIGAPILPTVRKMLADAKDKETKCSLMDVIGRMRASAEPAVPDLIVLMKDKEKDVRSCAYTSLGYVGAAAAPAVPDLIAVLRARAYEKFWAINTLGYIGPSAKAAVPDLIDALRDNELRGHAMDALGNIGPDSKPAVPLLIAILEGRKDFSNAAPPGKEYVFKNAQIFLDVADQFIAKDALKRIGTPEALEAVKRYEAKHP